jgi:branched-chain amino acid transport system ATP-binding protein
MACARAREGGAHRAAAKRLGGMTSPAPALTIERVAVHFGGLVAIADMNFVVNEGELLSLIGPNGAGKTTAFNVITGFLKPSKGEVRYRGASLKGLKPHQVASLGLVRTFQRTSVFGAHTVFDNVLTGLHLSGRSTLLDTLLRLPRERQSEQELREAAREILALVGIDNHAHEYAGALPYGDQRLLGVALALAAKPSMLLLDEPVSGMNASETGRFMWLLRKLRDLGMTILLVEHDMPMVMGVSDRIIVLNYGRIIAEGPPAAIRENPEVIRAYLGQAAAKRAAHA